METFGVKFMFVAESDWLQREDCLALFVYRFDLILKSFRRDHSAKMPISIDYNSNASGHNSSIYTRDNCVLVGSNCAESNHTRLAGHPGVADIDIVTAIREIKICIGT